MATQCNLKVLKVRVTGLYRQSLPIVDLSSWYRTRKTHPEEHASALHRRWTSAWLSHALKGLKYAFGDRKVSLQVLKARIRAEIFVNPIYPSRTLDPVPIEGERFLGIGTAHEMRCDSILPLLSCRA